MPIVLRFQNQVFDGRRKRFYFFILDLNDWLGEPFAFIFDRNDFKHWFFTEEEIASYPEKSAKRRFCEWFVEQLKRQDNLSKVF